MFHYYFTFRSVTAAQQGSKALAEGGLHGTLLRAPKFLSVKGCGYAIRLRSAEGKKAAILLRQAKVAFQGAYRVYPDGTVEAVRF